MLNQAIYKPNRQVIDFTIVNSFMKINVTDQPTLNT